MAAAVDVLRMIADDEDRSRFRYFCGHVVHLLRFFLKPPNEAFFFGCTRWMVFIAIFAKE